MNDPTFEQQVAEALTPLMHDWASNPQGGSVFYMLKNLLAPRIAAAITRAAIVEPSRDPALCVDPSVVPSEGSIVAYVNLTSIEAALRALRGEP